MIRIVSAVVLVLAFALVSSAQDTPAVETFMGYTYVRVNSALDNPSFNLHGGTGQLVVNFNKWAGFVTEIGASHNGDVSGYHLDSTLTHYMWGPRISIRHDSKFTPFFQFLMGGAHAGQSAQLTANIIPPQATQPIYVPGQPTLVTGGPVSVRASASQTAFAFSLGGGFDIKINKYVSFRPVALDWYMTRLQNVGTLTDNNQHNLQYSTGLNFTLGSR